MIQLMRCQASLGERLREDCPDNDCYVYLSLYETYQSLMRDYYSIESAGYVTEGTLYAIEKDILNVKKELDDMYFCNYEVLSYRYDNEDI